MIAFNHSNDNETSHSVPRIIPEWASRTLSLFEQSRPASSEIPYTIKGESLSQILRGIVHWVTLDLNNCINAYFNTNFQLCLAFSTSLGKYPFHSLLTKLLPHHSLIWYTVIHKRNSSLGWWSRSNLITFYCSYAPYLLYAFMNYFSIVLHIINHPQIYLWLV